MRLHNTYVGVLPRGLAGAVALVSEWLPRPYVVPGGVALVVARDGRGAVVPGHKVEDTRPLVREPIEVRGVVPVPLQLVEGRVVGVGRGDVVQSLQTLVSDKRTRERIFANP